MSGRQPRAEKPASKSQSAIRPEASFNCDADFPQRRMPHPASVRDLTHFATISAACSSTKRRASARTVLLRHLAFDPQWPIPIGLPDDRISAPYCDRNRRLWLLVEHGTRDFECEKMFLTN
jgi:hypothetical protein